jgi:hypothetical protein
MDFPIVILMLDPLSIWIFVVFIQGKNPGLHTMSAYNKYNNNNNIIANS